MTKIKSILWLMVAAITGGLAMVSCTSSNDNPIPPVIPPRDNTPVDYTVMYYSAGGENLDLDTEYDLLYAAQALQASDKQIRFIVQYKYSTQEGLNKQYTGGIVPCGVAGGLYRFELLPSQIQQNGVLGYFTNNMLYGNQQEKSKIYRSDSISSFINYCQRVAPAKNYILMFSDHGSGYVIWDDYPKTRSIVSDKFNEEDGDIPAISICDIRDGIRNSNIKHVKMINFDACNMNNIEVLTELMNETDYIMASSFITTGGHYGDLLNNLRGANDDATFEKTMSNYLNTTTQNIYNKKKEGTANPPCSPEEKKRCDWVLTNMAKFKAVPAAVKAFTTKLVGENASNFGATGLDDAATKCYHPSVASCSYDIGQYATLLANANNNLSAEAKALRAAIENAQVCHYYTDKVIEDFSSMDYKKLTCTVNLGAKHPDNPTVACLRSYSQNNEGKVPCVGSDGNLYYFKGAGLWESGSAKDFDKDAKWDNSYYTTAFDKATEWSKWMMKNTCFPTGNPPFGGK